MSTLSQQILWLPILFASCSCPVDHDTSAHEGQAAAEQTNAEGRVLLDADIEDHLRDMKEWEFADLLNRLSDINAANSHGRSLIHLCILKNRHDLITHLFARGVDPARQDEYGSAAIHLAGFHADIEALRTMLARGVDVNMKDKFGRTCLHEACSRQYKYDDGLEEKVLRPLLEAGADPNRRDVLGMTPLHFAAYCTEARVCRILMESGANASIVDYKMRTPADLVRDGMEPGEDEAIRAKYGDGARRPGRGSGRAEFIVRILEGREGETKK